MGIRVCTYNMGANLDDYLALKAFQNPSLKIESLEQKAAHQKAYIEAQQASAKRLVEDADVFLLQEVYDDEGKERIFIQLLKERHFQIIRWNERSDCAIALNATFEKIETQSALLSLGDLAIATAVHRPSGATVTFLSGHAPGCNLEMAVDRDDAYGGDSYCLEIAKKIDSLGRKNLVILGIDMNVNPEKWSHRFTPFFERKFELVRWRLPTNVKPDSITNKERELDFLWISFPEPGLGEVFRSLLPNPPKNKIELLPQSWGLSSELNASDHLPVLAKIILSATQ